MGTRSNIGILEPNGVEAFYSDHGLVYLFDPVSLSWTYYSGSKAVPLADALNVSEAETDPK